MIEQVEQLEDVLEPYAGQTVYCAADEKYYRWDPVEGWQKAPANLTLNAYDLNKQIIAQLQALDADTLVEKKQLIRNFVRETKNQHYMLLCRDINYFTLFELDSFQNKNEKLENILIDECMSIMGDIKSIERTEDGGAIEIWYTAPDDTYVMYFFPYDEGVILCV